MIAAAKGIVLAVIAAALVATATVLALGIKDGIPLSFARADLKVLLAMLSMTGFIAAAFILLVCVPLTVILKNLRRERHWSYPALGAVTGVLVADTLFAPISFEPFDLAKLSLVGGLAGLSAGVVWWHAYRKLEIQNV